MNRQGQAGFSMIELMVVVAIVAIIGAVALPSYNSYIQQSRRADAMAALFSLQIAQEKYRANNTSYGASVAAIGVAATSPEGYYTVAVASSAANSFVGTAAPTGSQAGDACGTFAVDNTGPNYTGSYAAADCWER
ncbi:type IV pilin protein [Marinobacterium arenosum]|uniref:type IV pilin protein n=1 Tax=Marinobacterium arenosum TaxID=2862496 RepID=UPI001C98AC4F|nr:type IV pilin protein [Marinobacterium arenosum]MBY4678234.1 prepilin-type N-terminal cleavage/methylation domain-containing protein [Marinobacterium arenosum]